MTVLVSDEVSANIVPSAIEYFISINKFLRFCSYAIIDTIEEGMKKRPPGRTCVVEEVLPEGTGGGYNYENNKGVVVSGRNEP